MTKDQMNKLKQQNYFKIKSKEEIEMKQVPKGHNPGQISRETKLLSNNLLGFESNSLPEDEIRFVRHTDP
jgi:hypothetical protein